MANEVHEALWRGLETETNQEADAKARLQETQAKIERGKYLNAARAAETAASYYTETSKNMQVIDMLQDKIDERDRSFFGPIMDDFLSIFDPENTTMAWEQQIADEERKMKFNEQLLERDKQLLNASNARLEATAAEAKSKLAWETADVTRVKGELERFEDQVGFQDERAAEARRAEQASFARIREDDRQKREALEIQLVEHSVANIENKQEMQDLALNEARWRAGTQEHRSTMQEYAELSARNSLQRFDWDEKDRAYIEAMQAINKTRALSEEEYAKFDHLVKKARFEEWEYLKPLERARAFQQYSDMLRLAQLREAQEHRTLTAEERRKEAHLWQKFEAEHVALMRPGQLELQTLSIARAKRLAELTEAQEKRALRDSEMREVIHNMQIARRGEEAVRFVHYVEDRTLRHQDRLVDNMIRDTQYAQSLDRFFQEELEWERRAARERRSEAQEFRNIWAHGHAKKMAEYAVERAKQAGITFENAQEQHAWQRAAQVRFAEQYRVMLENANRAAERHDAWREDRTLDLRLRDYQLSNAEHSDAIRRLEMTDDIDTLTQEEILENGWSQELLNAEKHRRAMRDLSQLQAEQALDLGDMAMHERARQDYLRTMTTDDVRTAYEYSSGIGGTGRYEVDGFMFANFELEEALQMKEGVRQARMEREKTIAVNHGYAIALSTGFLRALGTAVPEDASLPAMLRRVATHENLPPQFRAVAERFGDIAYNFFELPFYDQLRNANTFQNEVTTFSDTYEAMVVDKVKTLPKNIQESMKHYYADGRITDIDGALNVIAEIPLRNNDMTGRKTVDSALTALKGEVRRIQSSLAGAEAEKVDIRSIVDGRSKVDPFSVLSSDLESAQQILNAGSSSAIRTGFIDAARHFGMHEFLTALESTDRENGLLYEGGKFSLEKAYAVLKYVVKRSGLTEEPVTEQIFLELTAERARTMMSSDFTANGPDGATIAALNRYLFQNDKERFIPNAISARMIQMIKGDADSVDLRQTVHGILRRDNTMIPYRERKAQEEAANRPSFFRGVQ